MHGLGNDFIVINAIHQVIDIKSIPFSWLSNRHLGVGFDQLLLVTKSSQADFACRIFNADGSEAEQCGNGMRCIARFVQEEQLTQKKSLVLETVAGPIDVTIHDYDNIQVMMGVPCFELQTIPFIAEKMAIHYEILLDPAMPALTLTALSLGNPHAILRVANIKDAPVTNIGSKIAIHPAFPKGTNVGFMEIINPQQIRLRTFERGVGETFACGSNACAAVVAGILSHELDHKVIVELTYGNLSIEWASKHSPVIMSGPATRVFDGTYCI